MKIIFTSMLMMIMAVAQAIPLVNDNLDNGKKSKSNPSNTTVSNSNTSMQQLQEENALLKARLVTLESKVEDEKSMLQYKYTMLQLINMWGETATKERIEELQAQVNFNRLMGCTLLLSTKNLAVN